ncbi:alginate export family protein [Larkinella soli]|uniref:alginate export family protein n=1 Tax=Larkinella soli TaxID=1770527 RepID=UPI000FFB244B|nr:alginate export family protein [Larkinella soli]
MKKLIHSKFLLGFYGLFLLSQSGFAQFTLSGQLRTRTELRNGQGTLLKAGDQPAFFTSQRTRLSAGYGGYRVKFFTTLQDVRVWGQDASTINRTTHADLNGLMIHEAWAEIALTDTSYKAGELALKIGRQELVYDDVRLLGNLDWLQQGRRHDMALLKYTTPTGWIAHLGLAYNQNRELKTGTVYNGVPTGYTAGTNGIGTMYKSLQFLYIGKKTAFGNGSFLLIKDDFNKYRTVTDTTGKPPVVNRVYGNGTWSRYTTGFFLTGTAFKRASFIGNAYYQFGKDRDGLPISAWMFSIQALYNAGKRFSIGPGFDYTSGNNTTGPLTRNHKFDPLYGTPHKHWGYMDYFYVADGFGRAGLKDVYLRTRYKAGEKSLLTFDLHQFSSPNAIYKTDGRSAMSNRFGTELDLIYSHTLTKSIGLEGGYCAFLGTETLASAAVKNVTNAKKNATWAYLMINIRPDFLK